MDGIRPSCLSLFTRCTGLLDCNWRSEQCEIALIPLGATGVLDHGPGLTTDIEQTWICSAPVAITPALVVPLTFWPLDRHPQAGLGGRSSTASPRQLAKCHELDSVTQRVGRTYSDAHPSIRHRP